MYIQSSTNQWYEILNYSNIYISIHLSISLFLSPHTHIEFLEMLSNFFKKRRAICFLVMWWLHRIMLFFQALEVKQGDVKCLVARSKCHIQLGNSQAALDDAEETLKEDPNDIRVPWNILFLIMIIVNIHASWTVTCMELVSTLWEIIW